MAQISQNIVTGIEISRISEITLDLNHWSIRSHTWNMGSTSESYPILFSPTVLPVFSDWLSSTVASLLTLGPFRSFVSPYCGIQHVQLHWRKGRYGLLCTSTFPSSCLARQPMTIWPNIWEYAPACQMLLLIMCPTTVISHWNKPENIQSWSEPQQ